MSKTISVTKKIGKTFKQYGRFTIPKRMLKHTRRREVTVVLDEMHYVFEADKYGRIYLPPEIRQKVENMHVIEVATSDGSVLVKFKRF